MQISDLTVSAVKCLHFLALCHSGLNSWHRYEWRNYVTVTLSNKCTRSGSVCMWLWFACDVWRYINVFLIDWFDWLTSSAALRPSVIQCMACCILACVICSKAPQRLVILLAAFSGKRNVTVQRLSVCPSVCLSCLVSNVNRARGAYSTWLTRGQHVTRPTNISARQRAYCAPVMRCWRLQESVQVGRWAETCTVLSQPAHQVRTSVISPGKQHPLKPPA